NRSSTMSQHSIKAEDDRVSSIVQWAKVAAISALASLLFLVGLQPAMAQQICAGVGVGMVASGSGTVACGNGAMANGGGTIAVGIFAGFNSNDPANFGNTFLGSKSGQQVVGFDNIAVGVETGSQVQGNFNAAFGGQAGVQVTGDQNFAAMEG